MSLDNGKDYIYLIWKEPKTRRQYVVGQLTHNGKYEFSYGFEVEAAISKGFNHLIPFDDIHKRYKSDLLFPVFSSRLPDKKRKGIKDILLKYGLNEYDDYLLLKRSGAQLPIDNLKFIDPLLDKESEEISRTFDLAGVRHYLGCEGYECYNSIGLEQGEELELIQENDNPYDNNAIKVITKEGILIGYIPRYYNNELRELLNKGYKYICKVHWYEKDNNCEECLRVTLELNKG